jgi:hypothetical protein
MRPILRAEPTNIQARELFLLLVEVFMEALALSFSPKNLNALIAGLLREIKFMRYEILRILIFVNFSYTCV